MSLSWGNLQADEAEGTVAADSFYIEVSRDGSVDRVIKTDAPASSATILGLKNGITYEFRVFAATEIGSAEPAGPVSATPTTGAEGEVAGIIVSFTDPNSPAVDPGQENVPGEDRVGSVGLSVASDVTDNAVLVELSEPVSMQEAELIATELEGDPAVAWAEPDRFLFTSSEETDAVAAGVLPEQVPPTKDQLWNVYDTYGVGESDGNNADKLVPPAAPVTVAVIDTGITSHPDLDAKLVNGYDFVSSPEKLASVRQANAPPVAFDGDYINTDQFGAIGRDSNPVDPGDWRDVAPTRNSSWHGTQIAGVISQIDPDARIQPIRALSWRGGLLSDIAASITWASGGTLAGTPINETPSQVINMSFSVESFCPQVLQDAINAAHERGVTLIAAAGNANVDAAKFTPGNCGNVINVGASNKSGVRAAYSNYGEAIDLSAPGGDAASGAPVMTTSNNGTTNPDVFSYAPSEGTSVASAHVAAAASINIKANPSISPEEVYQTLTGKAAVKSFANNQCDPDPSITCGAGILSLAQIQSSGCSTSTYPSGIYTVVEFRNSGSCDWTVPAGVNKVDALLVAGGGGGGGGIGGGGGGGEVKTLSNVTVTAAGTQTIVVGTGGNGGGYYLQGVDGGDTSVLGTSVNGGGGGGSVGNSLQGRAGGSGGGGGCALANAVIAGLSVKTAGGFGSDGGGGNLGNGTLCVSGGGGGAGATGGVADASAQSGGAGGTGESLDLTGSAVSYGGGGGGGVNGDAGSLSAGSAGTGGIGGGGAGGLKAGAGSSNSDGFLGTDGLGGGGGGSSNGLSGGGGGGGVVILRYITPCVPVTSSFTDTTTTPNTTYTVVKFQDVGTCTWTPPVGVTTIQQLLVVGGGGGGSADGGGGGGGGGVRYGSNVSVTAGTSVVVEVGAGGAAGSWVAPSSAAGTGNASSVSFSDKTYGAGGGSGGGGWTTTSNAQSGTTSGSGTAGSSGSGGAGPGGCVSGAISQGTNGNSGFVSSISGTETSFGGGGGGGSASDTIPMTFLSSVPTLTQGSSGGGNGAAVQYGTVASTTGYFFTAGAAGSRGGGGGSGSACGDMGFNYATFGTRTSGGPGGAGTVIVSYFDNKLSLSLGGAQGPSDYTYGTGWLSAAPKVQLVSEAGVALTTSGVSVTASFTATSGSATLAGATVVTNSSGVADFSGLTLAGNVATAGTLTFSATDYGPVTSSSISIVKAPLVVTAVAQSVAFGSTLSSVTGSGSVDYSGFKGLDTSAVITGTVSSYTTTYTNTTAAGTAGVTKTPVISDLSATNYTFSAASGAVTITKADQASLTFTSTSGTYGTAVTLAVSGGTTAGAVTYAVTNGTAAGCVEATGLLTSTSSGTCTVTATMAGTTNYNSVASTATTVTLAQRSLGVAADIKTATFGATAPTFTYTQTGTRAYSDAITGVTYTFTGVEPTVYASSTMVPTAVGTYSIAPSTAVFNPGAASSYSITYTTSTYTISSGSATKLIVTGSASQTAGGAQTITITAVDSGGNTATTFTGDKSITISGPGVAPDSAAATFTDKSSVSVNVGSAGTLTFTAGVATTSLTVFKAESVNVAATDGSLVTTGSDLLALTVSPATAAALAMTTQPVAGVSGAALSTAPVVRVVDTYGNTVTTSTAIITASSSGGLLAGTLTVTASSGSATFSSMTFAGLVSGSYTLTFAASSVSDVVSASLAPSGSGTVTKLVNSTNASGALAGAAFTTQPAISITDANSNVKLTDNSTVVTAAVSAGGTLVGTTTATASSGLATFAGLGISGLAASYTLTFTVTGLTGTTQSVTVTVGAASALVLTTNAGNTTYGTDFPTQPVVKVVDAGGNTVTAYSTAITATVKNSVGSSVETATATPSSGVGTFSGLGSDATAGTLAIDYTSGALTLTSQSVSIANAVVTVTASSPSVAYGDAVPAVTPSYSGFVNGQSVSVLAPAPTCTTAYTTASAVGSLPSTSCSGGVAANYSFSFVSGAVTITRAAPTPVPSDGGGSSTTDGTVPSTGPVAPPADVVNRGVNGAVLVNGVESVSRLVPNGQDTGWIASMGNFQLAVSMEKADGAPERMSSAGEMQAIQGGRIVVAGSGYLGSSVVEVFMIANPSRNGFLSSRASVSGAVYLGQAQINAAGDLSHTFFVPVGMIPGQYVLQINGISPTNDSLSVNLAARVLEAVKSPLMRAGFVQRAAFYDGLSDVISVDGEKKLRQLVRGLPKNATSVQVEITGVSVSLASLDANLDLAQERAKKVANYLKKQGVSGTYTVTVTASFTVDGAERSVRSGPSSIIGPDGKPLTTATINYLVPEGT